MEGKQRYWTSAQHWWERVILPAGFVEMISWRGEYLQPLFWGKLKWRMELVPSWYSQRTEFRRQSKRNWKERRDWRDGSGAVLCTARWVWPAWEKGQLQMKARKPCPYPLEHQVSVVITISSSDYWDGHYNFRMTTELFLRKQGNI